MVSTTSDAPTTVTPQPAPAALIPLATSVSHGVRPPASTRSTQVLARSSTWSHGVFSENRKAQATMTTARRTQAVVVMAIGCGSGGGVPVGAALEARSLDVSTPGPAGRRRRGYGSRRPWGALCALTHDTRGLPGNAAQSAAAICSYRAPLAGGLFLSCTAAACPTMLRLAQQARMIASTAGRLPRNSLGLRSGAPAGGHEKGCIAPGCGSPTGPSPSTLRGSIGGELWASAGRQRVLRTGARGGSDRSPVKERGRRPPLSSRDDQLRDRSSELKGWRDAGRE